MSVEGVNFDLDLGPRDLNLWTVYTVQTDRRTDGQTHMDGTENITSSANPGDDKSSMMMYKKEDPRQTTTHELGLSTA